MVQGLGLGSCLESGLRNFNPGLASGSAPGQGIKGFLQGLKSKSLASRSEVPVWGPGLLQVEAGIPLVIRAVLTVRV